MFALVTIGGAALILLGLSVATRRPVVRPLDRDGYLDRWSALHGGYDPRSSTITGRWLRTTYQVGRPLARVGVRPNLITAGGLVLAAAVVALAGRPEPERLGLAALGRLGLAAVAVVGTGVLDGLDGCVAVLTGRATRLGSVIDSVADRVVDGLYLLALWRVGATAGLGVAAGSAVGLLEYTRARAGVAGMAEIGVVTVAERPSRVIVTALTLAGAGLDVDRAAGIATTGALLTLVLAVVGLVQLLVVVARRLT